MQCGEKVTSINQELQLPAPSDESAAMNSARRMVSVARRRSEEQQIACLEKELLASDARAELLPLCRDLHARQLDMADQAVKQWQELANSRRQQEAEQQLQKAASDAGQAYPAVRRLVEENADLAATRKSLVEHIAETTTRREQVTQQLDALSVQFTQLREKVDKVGLTNVIGLLLRKQREALPNLGAYRRDVSARQQTMGEEQLAILQLNDSRTALGNLDEVTKNVLQSPDFAGQGGNRVELEKAIREMLTNQRDYLRRLDTRP